MEKTYNRITDENTKYLYIRWYYLANKYKEFWKLKFIVAKSPTEINKFFFKILNQRERGILYVTNWLLRVRKNDEIPWNEFINKIKKIVNNYEKNENKWFKDLLQIIKKNNFFVEYYFSDITFDYDSVLWKTIKLEKDVKDFVRNWLLSKDLENILDKWINYEYLVKLISELSYYIPWTLWKIIITKFLPEEEIKMLNFQITFDLFKEFRLSYDKILNKLNSIKNFPFDKKLTVIKNPTQLKIWWIKNMKRGLVLHVNFDDDNYYDENLLTKIKKMIFEHYMDLWKLDNLNFSFVNFINKINDKLNELNNIQNDILDTLNLYDRNKKIERFKNYINIHFIKFFVDEKEKEEINELLKEAEESYSFDKVIDFIRKKIFEKILNFLGINSNENIINLFSEQNTLEQWLFKTLYKYKKDWLEIDNYKLIKNVVYFEILWEEYFINKNDKNKKIVNVNYMKERIRWLLSILNKSFEKDFNKNIKVINNCTYQIINVKSWDNIENIKNIFKLWLINFIEEFKNYLDEDVLEELKKEIQNLIWGHANDLEIPIFLNTHYKNYNAFFYNLFKSDKKFYEKDKKEFKELINKLKLNNYIEFSVWPHKINVFPIIFSSKELIKWYYSTLKELNNLPSKEKIWGIKEKFFKRYKNKQINIDNTYLYISSFNNILKYNEYLKWLINSFINNFYFLLSKLNKIEKDWYKITVIPESSYDGLARIKDEINKIKEENEPD